MLKRFSKILSLLLVFAMIVPGIAQAANLESAEGINRIKGENRWETAVAVSEKVAKGDTVILANGQNYPDALAGSALAKALNAPILLTKANELPVETAKQLEKLAPKTVILLGGETVIGEEVVEALKGYKIERIDGSNRAETAAKVAEKVVAKSGSKTAVLAYGNGFADALSVGPVAGAKGWPILFTSKAGQLTNTTKDALVKLGIKEVVIVGGTSVISDEVKNELANDYSVRRIAGANRYETSLEIAKEFGNVEAIMLANAQKYADALVGAPLAAALNAPIILVKDKSEALNEDQAKLVKENFEKEFYILGGEAVVSKEVEAQTIKLVEEAAEEAKELKVVSVSAINNTGVDVVFKEGPEEDLDDVTIEVLDNKGNVVEVEPITVAAGETEATFKFVKAIEGDMEGVWTIGGVKYDFDLKANLEAFINADNQIKLNKVLADLGIENVKVENMPDYEAKKAKFIAKLAEDKEELTVEAIQAWVDKVNADAISAEEEAVIVKAVVDAKKANNQIALLKALQNDAFVRVNADWIADYDGELVLNADDSKTLIDEESSVKVIQGAINKVNETKLKKATGINGIVDRDVLLKEKALQEKYATPTDKGEQTKDTKDALKAIDIQLAIVDVREASTPTRLKNALTKLDNLVDKSEKFMAEEKDAEGKVTYKGYVDANAKLYFDYKSDTDPKPFKEITKAEEVKPIIKAVNVAEDKKAGEVNKLIESTTVRVQNKQHPKATNGACYLLGYTVKFNLGESKTFADTKSVVAEFYKDKNVIGTLELKDPNSDKVKTAKSADGTIDVFGDYDSDSWKQEWNGKVTDIPTKVVVKVEFIDGKVAEKEIKGTEINGDTVPFLVEAVNRAETAEEMSRALINLEATGNDSAFTNLSKAAKLEVAELVLAARAEEKGIDGIPNTAGKFFENGTLTYKGVFDNVKVTEYNTFIAEVNKATTDIATMKKTLDNKDFLPEFAKLSAADQTLKAELVLNNIPKDKDGTVVGYKTIAEIKAAAGL